MKWPCPSGPYSTHTTLYSVRYLSGAAKGEGREMGRSEGDRRTRTPPHVFAASAVVPSLPEFAVAGAETMSNCAEVSIEGRSF